MKYPKWVTQSYPRDSEFPKLVGGFLVVYLCETGQDARKGLFWDMVAVATAVGVIGLLVLNGCSSTMVTRIDGEKRTEISSVRWFWETDNVKAKLSKDPEGNLVSVEFEMGRSASQPIDGVKEDLKNAMTKLDGM